MLQHKRQAFTYYKVFSQELKILNYDRLLETKKFSDDNQRSDQINLIH